MNQAQLGAIVNKPNVPQPVKDTAQEIINNPDGQVANAIHDLADAVKQMEGANTDEQREAIANQMLGSTTRAPTQTQDGVNDSSSSGDTGGATDTGGASGGVDEDPFAGLFDEP